MSISTAVLAAAGHAEPAVNGFWFGLVAFIGFMLLGAVVWSFQDVANRHAGKAKSYAAAHSGEEPSGH